MYISSIEMEDYYKYLINKKKLFANYIQNKNKDIVPSGVAISFVLSNSVGSCTFIVSSKSVKP